jgi:hypothetical protein
MCHCPDDARTLFALSAPGIIQSLSGTMFIGRQLRLPDLESRDPRISHVCLQTPSVIET